MAGFSPKLGAAVCALAALVSASCKTTSLAGSRVASSGASGLAAPCENMAAGESLRPGESIASCDKAYRLDFQAADSNVVLYRLSDNHAIWASGSSGLGATSFQMQTDGNLVLYNDSTSPATVLWTSATSGNPGAHFAVQTDGNLVVYTAASPAVAKWSSYDAPYLSCDSVLCTCGNFNPQAPTNGLSPDQIINECIAHTPNTWTMQLPATTYVVSHQINITHPMNLTTVGKFGSTTPCFTVPGSGGADDGLHQNFDCVQLYPANGSVMPWGGVLLVGNKIGSMPISQGAGLPTYDQPTFANISNVIVDHIVINGNAPNRAAANPIKGEPGIFEQLNNVFVQCTNCGFNNGGNWYSLAGGLSAEFVDGFSADHNMFAYHGNLQEGTSAANPGATPRHGECFSLSGSGKGGHITNNFMRQCTDQGMSLDGVGGFPKADGTPTYSFNGLNIQNNKIFARDNQYMSAGIHLNPTGGSYFTGTVVQGNQIDCADSNQANNAQCTMGILVGAGPFTGADASSPADLHSGKAADGLTISGNQISGPSVGILVQFNPVADNDVYVSGNTVDVTDDHYKGISGFFLPMSCKQWQGRVLATDFCCRATAGKNWYQTKASFPGANAGQTISWSRDTPTNPIIATALMVDPVDLPSFGTDMQGYLAFWRGGAEQACY